MSDMRGPMCPSHDTIGNGWAKSSGTVDVFTAESTILVLSCKPPDHLQEKHPVTVTTERRARPTFASVDPRVKGGDDGRTRVECASGQRIDSPSTRFMTALASPQGPRGPMQT